MDNNINEMLFGGIYVNKEKILEYLFNNTDSSYIYEELLDEMENAKREISAARSMFDNVSDETLIEVAIYSENVARKRYDYLLSIARSLNIRVGYDYIYSKNLENIE